MKKANRCCSRATPSELLNGKSSAHSSKQMVAFITVICVLCRCPSFANSWCRRDGAHGVRPWSPSGQKRTTRPRTRAQGSNGQQSPLRANCGTNGYVGARAASRKVFLMSWTGHRLLQPTVFRSAVSDRPDILHIAKVGRMWVGAVTNCVIVIPRWRGYVQTVLLQL